MRRLWLLVPMVLAGLILIGCSEGDSSYMADAGEDFEIEIGEAPKFDGCNSTGSIDNYRWTIIEAPDKMSTDKGKVIREIDPNCSFTLGTSMGVDEVGTWVVELEISNSTGRKSRDQVTVTVYE